MERVEPRKTWTTADQRAIARQWSRVLTAVINYQNKHRGLTPSDLMIAKDSGLSAGQVQHCLRQMEQAGIIQDSKGWPRLIVVKDAARARAVSIVEPALRHIEQKESKEEKMDTQVKPKKMGGARYSQTGRKSFMVRARQVAEFVIDYWDKHGKAPYFIEIREAVFGPPPDGLAYNGAGSVTRVVQQMEKLGWVRHRVKHHRDIQITGLGRAALFGAVEERLHTDTPVNHAPAERPPVVLPPPPVAVDYRRVEPEPVYMPKPSKPRVREATAADFGMREEEPPYLKGVSDVDLIIEVTRRGFKVSR